MRISNVRNLSLVGGLLFAFAASSQPAGKEVALPSLSPLVDSVKAAVVNVDVQKHATDNRQELMERFFGGRPRGRGGDEPLNQGSGSGFIIDSKGLVMTNNHVIAGAVVIRVRLQDGRSFEGEIVGRDPLTDIALVRLKGKFDALPSVRLGDSDAMHVGDWVVAIGNPFGLASSVSAGIISAMDRQIGASRFDQFLQTDAAINPGNSGGPLFNLKGEVIGMNTAIIGAATGIGFAVPSNLMRALLPQLESRGQVTRGWLGVSIQDVGRSLGRALGLSIEEGALVNEVNSGSPAEKGGLKSEDIIVSLDGEKVASSSLLTRSIALKRPETVVTLGVLRGGKMLELKVKIGVRPDMEHVGELEPKENGNSESRRRIGLGFQDIDPRLADSAGLPKQGALVVDVQPGSPADAAGLARDMVIVEANRKPVRSRDELMKVFKEAKAGTSVLLKIALPRSSTRTLLAVDVP
jgi:serine protease Do